MYNAFFGFTEPPFSIAPDPRFLFMSQRHREALAHLAYGTRESGGFVQLTGEVGTGKTTLCRCMLEQLPDNVDIALILNPRLTDYGLVSTVCDELGIPHEASTHGLKDLLGVLNRYLLEKHGEGRRTLLVVDEAQNLAPKVLEQIRLLTNLETNREKLLRIILIGQPELKRILARDELRQLAQRITARYHLLPLNREETTEYVRYRLAVAGQRRQIFTRAALRRLYSLSGGIPRLINIIADRALLGAYTRDRAMVNARIVNQAAREVMGTERRWYRRWPWRFLVAALILALLAGTWIYRNPAELKQITADIVRASAAGWTRLADGKKSSAATPAAAGSANTVIAMMANPHADNSAQAMAALVTAWGNKPADLPGGGDMCARAQSKGLRCLKSRGDWATLRNYNRPAMLTLNAADGTSRYVLLRHIDGDRASFEVGKSHYTLSTKAVGRRWGGEFELLWSPPLGIEWIQPGTYGDEVMWLRQRLNTIEGVANPRPAGDPRVYDDALKRRVEAFQSGRARRQDGVVDVDTLIHLNTALGSPEIPLLSRKLP